MRTIKLNNASAGKPEIEKIISKEEYERIRIEK